MKTEWRFVYKCRLCGALEGSTVTGSKEIVDFTLIEAVAKGVSSSYGIPVAMVSVHHCQSGACGVTDLQGAAEYPIKE